MKSSGIIGIILIVIGIVSAPIACFVVFGASFASRGVPVVRETAFSGHGHADAADAADLMTPQNVEIWIDVPSSAEETAVATGRFVAKDGDAVLLDAPLSFVPKNGYHPMVDAGDAITRINAHLPVFKAPKSGNYVVDVDVESKIGGAAPTAHFAIYSARDSSALLIPVLVPPLMVVVGIVLAITGRRRKTA
jgi:hypothetical protein